MTDSYFILGAGGNKSLTALRDATKETLGSNSSIVGIKATKNFIGLASGDASNRSLVYIAPTEIVLGTSYNQTSGSFVNIKKTGIIIGGTGTLQVNMTNFKLDASGDVTVKGNITATKLIADSNNGRFVVDNDDMGFFNSDGTTAYLTIDKYGNINANKDLTITAGAHFSVVANGSKFILRSNAIDYNTNLYIADNKTWKDAT